MNQVLDEYRNMIKQAGIEKMSEIAEMLNMNTKEELVEMLMISLLPQD